MEKFLPRKGNAGVEAVNAAWIREGNDGSISKSLVGELRSKLGLTGKKVKGAMLRRDPRSKATAINQAWNAEGNEGSISNTLFYNLKRATGRSDERSSPSATASSHVKGELVSTKTTASTTIRGGGHRRVLDEIEARSTN